MVHLYFNITKNTARTHPFCIENKTHSAMDFSSFNAKQKKDFTWPNQAVFYMVKNSIQKF